MRRIVSDKRRLIVQALRERGGREAGKTDPALGGRGDQALAVSINASSRISGNRFPRRAARRNIPSAPRALK